MCTEAFLRGNNEFRGAFACCNPEDAREECESSVTAARKVERDSSDCLDKAFPSWISICRRVCLFIVAVCILGLLCVFTWAYHHDSSSPLDVPESTETHKGNCSIKVRDSDIYMFKELVRDEKYDSLFVKLETSQNVSKGNRSHIYEPQNWIWARKDSPVLDLPSSYPIWSFGILDIRTKRNVTFHLELSPLGCQFEWGDEKTQTTVGEALVNFTLGESKRYNWCYSVRLRDVTKHPIMEKDFSFFVQDLGYKCCHNHHIPGTDQIVPKCRNTVIVQRMWTHMPFTMAFLTLLVFPNILVYIYQFLSFKSHVYWTHHRHESDEDDDIKTSEWVYTDYKSPVTFFSFLRSCPNTYACVRLCDCKISVNRILMGIGLLSLSLLFIVIPLVMYSKNEDSLQMLRELIHNNVPIGFMSFLFPFEDNHDNFMSFMKGPFVFFPVYLSLALIYLIIHSCIHSSKHSKAHLDTGIFSLNLDLIEKYGRIQISKNYRYGIFEIFHANGRAIFRWSFWKELMNRLFSLKKKGFLKILLILLILLSAALSVLVHCIPLLFASLLTFNNLIHRINNVCKCVPLYIQFLLGLALHCSLVYFLTIIYISSAEFISFVISFCVLAIIIFPSVAAGIFIYSLIALYYIVKLFRGVARKYASLRDDVISVSQSLNDKCNSAAARVEQREDEKCLLISGINILLVKYIVIVHSAELMKTNIANGCHCHLKKKVLKILTSSNLEGLKEIKISGVPVRIEMTISTKGKNILKVETGGMELKLQAVSRETLQSPADTVVTDEDDSCFVTYRNGLPGIPRELLDRTIDEYMPVGAERIQASFLGLFILGVVIWVISIIVHFEKMEQMDVITRSLILVVLVRLSDLVILFYIDVDDEQKLKIKKDDLKLTVLEFWTEKRFKLNSDVHAAMINKQETTV